MGLRLRDGQEKKKKNVCACLLGTFTIRPLQLPPLYGDLLTCVHRALARAQHAVREQRVPACPPTPRQCHGSQTAGWNTSHGHPAASPQGAQAAPTPAGDSDLEHGSDFR